MITAKIGREGTLSLRIEAGKRKSAFAHHAPGPAHALCPRAAPGVPVPDSFAIVRQVRIEAQPTAGKGASRNRRAADRSGTVLSHLGVRNPARSLGDKLNFAGEIQHVPASLFLLPRKPALGRVGQARPEGEEVALRSHDLVGPLEGPTARPSPARAFPPEPAQSGQLNLISRADSRIRGGCASPAAACWLERFHDGASRR